MLSSPHLPNDIIEIQRNSVTCSSLLANKKKGSLEVDAYLVPFLLTHPLGLCRIDSLKDFVVPSILFLLVFGTG